MRMVYRTMAKNNASSSLLAVLLYIFIINVSWLVAGVSSLPLSCRAEYDKIVHIEGELIDFCRTVIKEEERLYSDDQNVYNFTRILSFLEEAEEHDRYNSENEHNIVDNPLALYKLMRWLSDKWSAVLDEMANSIIIYKRREFLKLFNEYRQVITGLDINAAVKNIAELIYIYELPIHAVSLGTFGPAQTTPLQNDDIFQFIESLNDIGYHRTAMDWLTSAFGNSSIKLNNTIRYRSLLASTYYKLREYEEAKSVYEGILKDDENSRGAKSNIKLIEQHLKNASQGHHVDKYSDYVKDIKKYCYEYLHTPENKAVELHCREIGIPNSNDTIRVNELHRRPDIFLLYEVFNQHRRRVLIEKASDKLWSLLSGRFASHQAANQGTKVYFKNKWWLEPYVIRMRNITFRHHIDFEVHPNILSWISVVNYGAGMREKMIRFQKTLLNTPSLKQQIAQYYVFLQEPDWGGELVFPEIKLRIKPVKGAAVFWQFRTRNTPVHRKLVRRIYCPVLTGSQWNAKFVLEHQDLLDWVTF